MKIQVYRNNTWYSGLCLDDVLIKCDKEMNIENMYQYINRFEKMGYEVEDLLNNPFTKTEQFEYYNKYDDKVVVRVQYQDKSIIEVVKQYNKIENCDTTIEVITRLGALNKLHEDVVRVFQKEYGINKNEEEVEE
jgi:hypothetical protein